MSSPGPPKRARHEYGLMRPNGASFVGSASGIHFIQTVYHAVSKAGLPAHIIPGEDDQLPNSTPDASIWHGNELFSVQGTSVQLQNLLDWSQSYFDHWHPAFPFLHAPTVIQWLSNLCNGMTTVEMTRLDTMQQIIVRSILSISLADGRQSGHSIKLPPTLVYQSYEEAICSVQPVLIKRPSIESLQAAMSVQLFLISMLRFNAASRLQGIIIRLILQMGLHRCPRRFQTFTSSEASIRQRIFWSAYIVDRYLSQCLGLPITLRDDDIDVCNMNYEQHTPDAEQALAMDPRLAFSSFIAKHARLKGEVIELCNKSISHRQFDTDSFQRLNAEITKWTNEVEEYIECCTTQATSLNSTQRSVLSALKHEIIISLNRPRLTATKSSSEYSAAIQTCISASRSLIVELHEQILRKYIVSAHSLDSASVVPEFIAWPFMTWSVWISAFLILFAGTENEVSRGAAVKLSNQSVEILQHSSARGSVWPNACAAAIRDLFARFQNMPTTSSARLHDVMLPQDEPFNEENPSKTQINSESSPQAATSAENEQENRSLATAQTASETGTGAIYNVDKAPESDSNVPTSRDPNLSVPTALNRPDTADTSLANIFSTGNGMDQTEMSLFQGFDIPFWMDDDLYASLPDTWDFV